ncbi:hypothetical protein NPIL_592341 [Nephila pilipes]|uniref:Uncharacterized protein n=1 Tax=Nephila pilipes TaxID=299642 RepID=A0A8X6NAJ4_NEPPI|nr:hypothetical protein NPIL_592341 [Nephila pilipes]
MWQHLDTFVLVELRLGQSGGMCLRIVLLQNSRFLLIRLGIEPSERRTYVAFDEFRGQCPKCSCMEQTLGDPRHATMSIITSTTAFYPAANLPYRIGTHAKESDSTCNPVSQKTERKHGTLRNSSDSESRDEPVSMRTPEDQFKIEFYLL